MTDVTITNSAGPDGTLHVAVAGEIDMDSGPMLATRLRDTILADETRTIAVDLARVTFMDSTGIRALVVAYELATEHAVTFYITNTHEVPGRVLELTGLLTLLTAQAR